MVGRHEIVAASGQTAAYLSIRRPETGSREMSRIVLVAEEDETVRIYWVTRLVRMEIGCISLAEKTLRVCEGAHKWHLPA